MAKIYTTPEEEDLIEKIRRKGLGTQSVPKWTVLRLAFAKSIHLPAPPNPEDYPRAAQKKGEYALEQVTGLGQGKNDFTDLFKALLSVYHQRDLFADEQRFVELLEIHIRRGLREFKNGWRESHDFHEYLYQELFAGESFSKPKDAGSLREKLAQALKDLGLKVAIPEEIEGVRLNRFVLRLDDINQLSRLKSGLEKLALALGLGKSSPMLEMSSEEKTVDLDLPREETTWKQFTGADLKKWLEEQSDPSWSLPLFPGVDVLGKPVGFDLVEAPHLFVAGATGSGKSVCLHALIYALARSRSKEQVQLILLDPKQVEFALYETLPHLWEVCPEVVTQAQEMPEVLELLAEAMEERYSKLKEEGVRDLRESRQNFPHIVLFVEELADLLLQAPEAEKFLVRLAQKGRAAGIHLVLATQRPDAETFKGLLRSNIPARIALFVQKASESKIILDETGAEKLTGQGDMLLKLPGQPLRRLHGVLITQRDIQEELGSQSTA